MLKQSQKRELINQINVAVKESVNAQSCSLVKSKICQSECYGKPSTTCKCASIYTVVFHEKFLIGVITQSARKNCVKFFHTHHTLN